MFGKLVNSLATETGEECFGIEDFKMDFEFDHEDVIWCAMGFVALGHADERVGGGRLKDFVEFFL